MNKLVLALIVALGLFVLIEQLVLAADPVVTETRVEAPERLTVGDPFRIVVKVEADQGTTVFLAPGGLPPELELTQTPRATNRNIGNGRSEVTLNLDVAAFVPGDLPVPPIILRYRTAGGQTGQLETAPTTLSIASVLPVSGEVVPRDLKPQAEIGTPPATWIFVAIAAAFVALLVVLGLLVWRRRVLKRRALTPEEPVAEPEDDTPEDRARGQLDRAAREFAASGDYAPYYGEIAVAVRTYLTERFGFAAFALTTSELQAEMQSQGVDRWQARLVSGLLTQCDSAVYAGYRPAHERADADLTAAYEVVEMSRPAPPVVEVSVT